MLEARVSKAVVVHQKGKTGVIETTLMGVAEYYGEKINFKVKYDWNELDKDWFVGQLREQLAEGFDLPVYRVDVREQVLLRKMEQACLTSVH